MSLSTSTSSTGKASMPKKTTKTKGSTKEKSKKEKVVKQISLPKDWNEDEVKDLRAAFNLLDKNSDGRIQPDELHEMLVTFGINVPEAHILRIIERASDGGTKGLTEPEFFAWILPLLETDETNPDQDLLAAFQVFDKDKNGFITKDELKTGMELMGETLDESELDQLIALADLDHDGQIDYEEFIRMLT